MYTTHDCLGARRQPDMSPLTSQSATGSSLSYSGGSHSQPGAPRSRSSSRAGPDSFHALRAKHSKRCIKHAAVKHFLTCHIPQKMNPLTPCSQKRQIAALNIFSILCRPQPQPPSCVTCCRDFLPRRGRKSTCRPQAPFAHTDTLTNTRTPSRPTRGCAGVCSHWIPWSGYPTALGWTTPAGRCANSREQPRTPLWAWLRSPTDPTYRSLETTVHLRCALWQAGSRDFSFLLGVSGDPCVAANLMAGGCIERGHR